MRRVGSVVLILATFLAAALVTASREGWPAAWAVVSGALSFTLLPMVAFPLIRRGMSRWTAIALGFAASQAWSIGWASAQGFDTPVPGKNSSRMLAIFVVNGLVWFLLTPRSSPAPERAAGSIEKIP